MPDDQRMAARKAPIPALENRIFAIRGLKVMLDRDLADLYGVEPKILNQAVKRNRGRFPEDFMFQITLGEMENLRFQFGTSSSNLPDLWNKHGGRRYLPHAFTEQGVAMLSGLLNSDRAVAANIEIMRAFVRLRHSFAANAELSRKVDDLEKKYDGHFKVVFDALRELMRPPAKSNRPIGFVPPSEN